MFSATSFGMQTINPLHDPFGPLDTRHLRSPCNPTAVGHTKQVVHASDGRALRMAAISPITRLRPSSMPKNPTPSPFFRPYGCYSRSKQMTTTFQPMPLSRRAKPFNHPEWLFELKYDGFRGLARIKRLAVRTHTKWTSVVFVSRTRKINSARVATSPRCSARRRDCVPRSETAATVQ